MLSELQTRIVTMVKDGDTNIASLAEKIGCSKRVIKAQLTRITKSDPKAISKANQKALTESSIPQISDRFKSDVSVDNASDIYNTIAEAQRKETITKLVGEVAAQFQNTYQTNNIKVDTHPLVLMGVTIEFVKLCGGRIMAHQLIEDVHAAISTMVGNNEVFTLPDHH